MEMKPMTIEEYNRINRSKYLKRGCKQAIVEEFLKSGADVAEIKNFDQTPKNFQITIIQAVNAMHVNVKCSQRKGRIFLIRGDAV